MEKQQRMSPAMALLRVLQGALIGLGAVLPGISGGVLCVIFGIYRPVMELLSDPRKNYKTHLPKLAPVFLGMAVGFLGVANLLAFFLDRYPNQSVCLFVGLIGGMLPSLLKQAGEQGRTKASWAALVGAFALVLGLLVALEVFSVQVTPSLGWYLFCGFCLALSVIAPGMSFSTLLMPLGLYTPFVEGLGRLWPSVLVPGIAGAVITVVLAAAAHDAVKGKDTALTVVVRLHGNQHIFHRGQQCQRPDHQRKGPQNQLRVHAVQAAVACHNGFHHIHGRCANITIHHANGHQCRCRTDRNCRSFFCCRHIALTLLCSDTVRPRLNGSSRGARFTCSSCLLAFSCLVNRFFLICHKSITFVDFLNVFILP